MQEYIYCTMEFIFCQVGSICKKKSSAYILQLAKKQANTFLYQFQQFITLQTKKEKKKEKQQYIVQKKEIKSGIYHQSMYINFVKHGVNALKKVYEEASVMQISEADNISCDLHNQASLLKCYLRFRLTFSYICFSSSLYSRVAMSTLTSSGTHSK